MYSPPSRTRKGFISLLFLIQYTSANDSGSHAVNQEDGLASSLANSENALLAISDPPRFATPFTSTTDPSEDSQDDNSLGPFLLSEPCNSPTEQPYFSRRRSKRQTEKAFCDNPHAGALHQLQNNNENTKSNSPARNPEPKPNERDQTPPSSESSESFRSLLYAVPGLNGKPDPAACKNPEYPLFQIPSCAFMKGYL